MVFLFWPAHARAGSCPDSLAAYWKLDEVAGAVFADSAGGYDGSCGGACPVPVPGELGNARQFAASTPSPIQAPGAAFDWPAGSSFSIECWVKKEAGTTGTNEAVVSRTESSGAVSWWVGLGSSGQAAFVLAGAKGNTAQSLRGTKNLANGKWHHVTAIRDGAAGENRLYVDGVLEASVKAAYPYGFAAAAGTPAAIGGFAGSYFSGIVDEVAIYNRALAEKEFRGHYFLVRDYCAPCDLPVKIMPFGDSITAGSSSGVDDPAFQISYRKDLWDRLTREGYHIDYVGSQMAGQGYGGFDPDNEGHPGWSAGALANYAYNWVSSSRPDVVLIHAGTNNLTTDPADIERLLNEIDRYSEDVTVVLARIINQVPYNATVSDFNDNVAAMVQARIAAGDKIILVDQENGAGLMYQYQPQGDMWDHLHPYATGYAKMANVWYGALSSFLQACPAVYAPLITSQPVLSARAGSVYTYQVKASGSPAPDFRLVAGPAGMQIDAATGLIEWTPAAEGSYPVIVETANTQGSDQQSFTIGVLPEAGLAANLLALYHFDRTASEGDQLASDFSGNGHDATCGPDPAQCPTWTSNGKFGGAYSYDGVDDRFTIADDPAWDVADFSLAAWINIRAYTGSDMYILGHRGADTSTRALWLAISSSSGNRITFLRNNATLATSPFTLTTGSWHHVAATYQAATGTAALYIDGQLVSRGAQTGALYPTSNVVDLGFRTSRGDSPFNGLIDEVAVWGRTLAAEEVQELSRETAGIGLASCGEGETKSCYSGPAGTEGVGVCRSGVQTCSGGQWGVCQGEVLPGQEI
ncbi:MAG: GDSL-type esterase/lipase family protein, partial [Desulfobacteraceae bacterium]|nr:GDSL-type esterase/lipase family protein [Desulfobacteraceae bacterium]